jgi:hypothetical protein
MQKYLRIGPVINIVQDCISKQMQVGFCFGLTKMQGNHEVDSMRPIIVAYALPVFLYLLLSIFYILKTICRHPCL